MSSFTSESKGKILRLKCQEARVGTRPDQMDRPVGVGRVLTSPTRPDFRSEDQNWSGCRWSVGGRVFWSVGGRFYLRKLQKLVFQNLLEESWSALRIHFTTAMVNFQVKKYRKGYNPVLRTYFPFFLP